MRAPVARFVHSMTAGVIALLAVLIVVTPLGLAWSRRQGKLRSPGPRSTRPGAGRATLSAADLRDDLGPRATLVQFSSAFCAPCRATRQILGEVAGMLDGVRHIEIDAEARLDLVRRLNIYATPTVVVLGPDGTIARQASGQPRKADVIAALGDLMAESEETAGSGSGNAVAPVTPGSGSGNAAAPAAD